jgi:hypothetical protein
LRGSPRPAVRAGGNLVGRGIANPQERLLAAAASNVVDFEAYLKAQNKRNIRQILCYTKKYRNVLETGDAACMAMVKPSVRRHAMEALSLYSKHIGCCQVWKDIRTKYQLSWGSANEDNLRYFTNYLQGHGNLEVMLDWLKDALSKLPMQVRNVLLHNVLTGLRPSENLLCIKLVQTDFDYYANEDLGVLENFRYPEFISKKTKKAYLTVYDDSILQVALDCKIFKSWETFRKQLNRLGIHSIHTKYCRAIFATWLRKCGIEQEVINIYQGRVPSTVFQASYLKTNIKEDRKRILQALEKLQKNLLTG